ncbi:monomeric sarcosine oxidase-like [Glandiceps talaboti]
MAASDPQFYEYIVVGCGGIGSATIYWLSRRVGPNVLGLEQFKLGHNHGGSQDHSRTMRVANAKEKYIKLFQDSYSAFEEVEEESGIQLIYKTGGLQLFASNSPSNDFLVEKTKSNLKNNNLEHALLQGEQIQQRFHQFNTEPEIRGLYMKDMGLIDAAMANGVHTQLARQHGATILENCTVTKLVKDTDDVYVLVHTNQGIFRCRRLIISSGAWTNKVIESLGFQLPLTVSQEQVTYVATPHIKDFTKDNFPTWDFFGNDHLYYGHPIHGNTGVKIAIHDKTNIVTTETRTYEPDPVKERKCLDFLKKCIPKAVGPVLYTKTCLYTNAPDNGFILDSLASKGYPQIFLFIGSGHAFKFSCLFGKILSELAVDGKTDYGIVDEFTLNREVFTNPDFKQNFTP